MISNGWFLGLEVALAVSLLTAIVRRVWPVPDPSAKRIAYLERRVGELSKRFSLEESPLTEVQELITQGRKINAIKLYREQTGVGLKEAKDAVESLEAQMKASRLV